MIELRSFGDLGGDVSATVLQWRNHPDIRSVMYTDRIITLQEHEAFIASLRKREDKRYFVVYADNQPIGIIDLIDITQDSATIGLYADPFNPRPGAGSMLMQALMEYALDTLNLKRLVAECFADNPRAKHLYEKFDFTETKRFFRHGREVIHMEYHHDHRPS